MFSQNVGKEYLFLKFFSAYQKTFHFYLKTSTKMSSHLTFLIYKLLIKLFSLNKKNFFFFETYFFLSSVNHLKSHWKSFYLSSSVYLLASATRCRRSMKSNAYTLLSFNNTFT